MPWSIIAQRSHEAVSSVTPQGTRSIAAEPIEQFPGRDHLNQKYPVGISTPIGPNYEVTIWTHHSESLVTSLCLQDAAGSKFLAGGWVEIEFLRKVGFHILIYKLNQMVKRMA